MPVEAATPPPMRPDIVMSWRRSRLSGVEPTRALQVDLTADFDQDSRLLRSAMPVLEQLGQEIADAGLCLLLADRDGRIVRSVVDSTTFARRVENLGIVTGACFSEDLAGTTSLGTPLEVRRGVVVNGPEHFLERLRGLSCYGSPIIHPATGRVEGVLDMTVEDPRADPLFIPFVDRAVREIERRLLDGSKVSQQRLVAAFQDTMPPPHAALAAIGTDMLLHNNVAANLLSSTDYVLLREIAAELRPGERRRIDIELACGEAARVEAESVIGSEGGAIFVVVPLLPEVSHVPRGVHVNAAPPRLSVDISRVAGVEGPVAVCGEPGSGRSTAAREIAGDAAAWLDAADVVQLGETQWLQQLTDAAGSSAPAIVIEHVESLPESIVAALKRLLDRDTGPRLVLTSPPLDDLALSFAALVARCPGRIDIPPLRRRRLELGAISRRMLSELEGKWELTPAALAALCAADWPGNLSELASALRAASQTATGGRIDLRDLPTRYQDTGRITHLGGRERAERQAIVDALANASGNKVHAARELGISRSTLYSRMKALGIPS
ncbi:transcriptional activator of acetoin/glycerol metabolism (plasmid) [Mycolicibacterium chubuense NBB4]|uniref:Transcriptional activator of acetoin/glycerol metabolism n=1 Tax=Mycolicibacterium chubuense (strain NBB4) TaxID=710421 RepID=I4BTB4_MYCCN|nr:helix-turn-helix domain-containing protein [Mycolicibacterium chubuense]AFM20521.1 transcriptional activator of acetoin/glycerol metabolism [Mycolicibacterium chubuense NBB4]